MIHILNRRDPKSAQVPNSFALTVYLADILYRKFRIEQSEVNLLQQRYKADQRRNWNWK